MRAQRLSALAVGALAALGAVPYAAVSAQAAAAPTAAASAQGAPEPATELIVQGAGDDYIVGGYTGVAQPPAQTITVTGTPLGGQATRGSVHFSATNLQPGGWDIGGEIDAPVGSDLQVGKTYTGAQSTDPNGTFIYVSADHRSCDRTSGSFTIYQLAYSGGTLTSLEAQLTQSCDIGQPSTFLLRYNATGDLPPGAPTGRPLPAGVGTVEPMTFTRGSQIVSAAAGAVDGPVLGAFDSGGTANPDVGRTAWSPLGTRLFFTGAGSAITSVLRDGTAAQPVTSSPAVANDGVDEEPAVSGDGSTVVTWSPSRWTPETGQLKATSTDGSQGKHGYQLPLGAAATAACTHAEHYPSLSPGGALIFECDGDEAQTWRLVNGRASLLIGNADHAVYSADGSRIAFVRKDQKGVPQVFTVGADGVSGLTQVSQAPYGAAKPAWSPDGRYLAYVDPRFQEIVEIPSGGGAPVGSIPNADNPNWTRPIIDSRVIREWGADRVSTAVAASQLNFADHGSTTDRRRMPAGAVVLSRSDTFADALGGSALAVRKDAPLLITGTASLDPQVKAEISRVLAPGGTVYLLGGTAALSPAVASALSGFHVVRLSGSDRYDTAVQIVKQISPNPRVVTLATGDNYPDALAAGATGEPVLLTSGATMPKATAAYLNTLNPDPASGTEIVTIGGPGDAALHAAYLGGKLPSWPSQISRLKLAGDTRYATALLVAQAFFVGDTDAALATGTTWPDALSGGAMVGHRGGPLLLTDPSGITPGVLDYLHSQSASLFALHLLGGPAALPDTIAQQGAGVIGLPGHVRIDGFTSGGAYPYLAKTGAAASGSAVSDDQQAAKSPSSSDIERAVRSAHVTPMTREG